MSTQPADGGGGNTITDRQLFDQAVSTPDPTPSPAPTAREDGRLHPGAQPSQTPSDTGGATDATQAPDVPSTRPDLQPQQPAQAGQQPRTPEGKFAPKGPPQPQQRQPEDHRVPLREMLDERERRQRVEAEYNQLLQQVQQQQRQQHPQGPETIFDGPDEYLNQRVIAPLRQEMQMEMMRRTDAQSREFANVQFGVQAVNAALADISRIRQTPHGNVVFQQIMSSGHPYGELVKWHNQARAQAAIGNDPQAWLTQQQRAWFNDPQVRAAMAQDLRQEYARTQQQKNGSGNPPNVSLPPPLSSVPSTSGRNVDLGDLSSESLFQHAIK
jgi:hypothetical protein